MLERDTEMLKKCYYEICVDYYRQAERGVARELARRRKGKQILNDTELSEIRKLRSIWLEMEISAENVIQYCYVIQNILSIEREKIDIRGSSSDSDDVLKKILQDEAKESNRNFLK